jgi:RecB family exonuclease
VSTSFEVRPWRHASASQITTWRSCHLKWWWQTIGGFRAETTKAQQQGQEIHAQIETYLKGGPVPENPIAVSGLIHLPSPHEINVEGVEYGFALESSDAPVPIVGFIDLLDSPRRRIIDHKTTSDFKYMKTPDVLMQDLAAPLNLGAALLLRACDVALRPVDRDDPRARSAVERLAAHLDA